MKAGLKTWVKYPFKNVEQIGYFILCCFGPKNVVQIGHFIILCTCTKYRQLVGSALPLDCTMWKTQTCMPHYMNELYLQKGLRLVHIS